MMNYIVYITDENYAMPTCTSIQSIIENNTSKSNYHIFVLAHELSLKSKGKLMEIFREEVTIEVIDVNDKYTELYDNCLSEKGHVSETALCKFRLPNLFPEVDRILYIDSDIIINGNLEEVFECNISEYYLAAVDDMGDSYVDGVSELAARIGIPEYGYFNSGFMYLNLEKMRNEDIPAKLQVYKKDGINYFVDQDALNVVLGGKRYSLPYRYNFRTPILEILTVEEVGVRFFGKEYKSVDECLREQVVLHMTDWKKPWKYNIPWISDVFMKYYRMSPYKDEKKILESPLVYLNNDIQKLLLRIVKSDEYVKEKIKECNNKYWRFPFEKIEPNSRIVLYGAGNVGRDFNYLLSKTKYCNIVAWVDKNWRKLEGDISAPQGICNLVYDKVLIAIYHENIIEQVREELIAMGIRSEDMVDII